MNKLSYLTDSYDAKIKRVNDIAAPFNFVFITDIHNRLNELNFIYHNIPFKPAEISFAVNKRGYFRVSAMSEFDGQNPLTIGD